MPEIRSRGFVRGSAPNLPKLYTIFDRGRGRPFGRTGSDSSAASTSNSSYHINPGYCIFQRRWMKPTMRPGILGKNLENTQERGIHGKGVATAHHSRVLTVGADSGKSNCQLFSDPAIRDIGRVVLSCCSIHFIVIYR